MIRTEKRLRLCTALLICNIAFIWGNSLLPGEVSGAFSDFVKELLAKLFASDDISASGGGLLRKLAHFSEFALLGALFSWLFGMLQKKIPWAGACGFLTACVDETIQRFVPDRGPSILDVGIDTCGVLTGMLLIFIGHSMYRKRIHNPLEENKK